MRLAMLYFTLALLALVQAVPLNNEDITTFEQFKAVFNKHYASTQDEADHQVNFDTSLKWIKENQGKDGLQFAINELADLSSLEFAAPVFNMSAHSEEYYDNVIINVNPEAHLPVHFDWREHVHFHQAENQRQCGACWAFSAAAVIETAYAIKNKVQVTLSKQELVDCTLHTYDHNYINNGCHGGFPWDAFKYAVQHGILEEDAYPYKALSNQVCYTKRVNHRRFHINNFHRLGLNARDESIMTVIKNHGPVSVHIMAHNDPFKHYKNGVLRTLYPGTTHITHAVAVIGWGNEHGVDYWLIRNSWGPGWGQQGYGKIERHHNNMGINNYVSFPILN